MKAAFVGIVGRPSAGKSTLINTLCGHKVSIVSTVPQTTRNRIRGIYTTERGQLVLVDTPGFHHSERKFNRYLKELVLSTLKETDLTLYLIDVSRPSGEEERALMSLLAGEQERLVVALNKIDLEQNYLEALRAEVERRLARARVLQASALTGRGLPELASALFELAPEGEFLYPEEYYTDQTPEFRIAEIVREKAILNTRQELPHSFYVELSDLEMREEEGLLWVRGFIYVERESQKGILVGKQGDRIRGIIRESEAELDQIFPYRVKLDLRVKVKSKWKKTDHLLRKLIR